MAMAVPLGPQTQPHESGQWPAFLHHYPENSFCRGQRDKLTKNLGSVRVLQWKLKTRDRNSPKGAPVTDNAFFPASQRSIQRFQGTTDLKGVNQWVQAKDKRLESEPGATCFKLRFSEIKINSGNDEA